MALDEAEVKQWKDQLAALKLELTTLITEAKEANSPSISALQGQLAKVNEQLTAAAADLAELRKEKTEAEKAAKAAKEAADKEAADKLTAEQEAATKAGLSLEAYRQQLKDAADRQGRQQNRKRPAAAHWA